MFQLIVNFFNILILYATFLEHAVRQLVETLRYKVVGSMKLFIDIILPDAP